MASQNFANHTRWHPLFHFFVLPVIVINVIWAIVRAFLNPGLDAAWGIVFSLALALLMAFVRTNPLKAQDRIIRLEERIRYQEVLPAGLVKQAEELSIGQIVALRFASDDELEKLVRAVLSGELARPMEIKRAIRNWRPDTFRI